MCHSAPTFTKQFSHFLLMLMYPILIILWFIKLITFIKLIKFWFKGLVRAGAKGNGDEEE